MNNIKNLLTTSALILSVAISPMAYANEKGKTDSMMQSSKNAEKAPYDIQFLDRALLTIE